MRTRFLVLALVALFAFGGTGSAALAAGGGTDRFAQETTTEEDDDGTDYGWVGLLGLAGLAGLLGLRRNDRDRHVDTSARTPR